MIEYENKCVDCPSMGMPCIHCGNDKIPHMICDNCEEDVDELYEYEGEQWCVDCILDSLTRVDIEE